MINTRNHMLKSSHSLKVECIVYRKTIMIIFTSTNVFIIKIYDVFVGTQILRGGIKCSAYPHLLYIFFFGNSGLTLKSYHNTVFLLITDMEMLSLFSCSWNHIRESHLVCAWIFTCKAVKFWAVLTWTWIFF